MDQSRPGGTSYHYLWDGTFRYRFVSFSPKLPMDADGALHAVVTSPADNVSSGIIAAAAQDPLGGLTQTPLGLTRFRATFPNPGTFPYLCVIHDDLGMKGTVIVH